VNQSIPFQMKAKTKSSVYLSTLLPWGQFLSDWQLKRVSPQYVSSWAMWGVVHVGENITGACVKHFYECLFFLVHGPVGLCLSFKLLHKHKCTHAGRIRALSPKVSNRGKQAAAALIKPYVSGLKRVFSSIICLSSMSFHHFCRSEFCCTGDDLPSRINVRIAACGQAVHTWE
jgi:hypothetical protein